MSFDPDVDVWTAESLGRQRALRAAVLIDAIRCLIGAAGARERRVRCAALRWFSSGDTRAPFSFENVCDSLGLEAARMRRALLTPSFGADGVARIALGGEPARGEFRRLPMRRPRRDRVRYAVLEEARLS